MARRPYKERLLEADLLAKLKADGAFRVSAQCRKRHRGWVFMKIWLALTVLFNMVGLASLTERLATWSVRFQPSIDAFQSARDVVFAPVWFTLNVAPMTWIADLILVWLGFFVAWNLLCFGIHGYSLRGTLRAFGIGRIRSIRLTTFFLLLGPLAPLWMHRAVSWRLDHQPRRPTGVQQDSREKFPSAVGVLVFESLTYTGLLFGLFTVLVLANGNWT